MRQTRVSALIGSTVTAGLLAAGCTPDTTADPEPDVGTSASPSGASASTAPPVATAAVASCVVGQWRTRPLTADARRGPAGAEVSGGAGISITIGPAGATVIDFSGMQPVTFGARLGTAEVRGTFTYAGGATGTMTTGPAASAAPSPPTTGTWQPAGDVDWDGTRVTVDLIEPVRARPFDDVPIGRYTGDAAARTGNAVDVDPFFDAGRYTCGGDTLTVTPDQDADLPLTLERA